MNDDLDIFSLVFTKSAADKDPVSRPQKSWSKYFQNELRSAAFCSFMLLLFANDMIEKVIVEN